MSLESFNDFIQDNYELYEWRHASAIFKNDFPSEWENLEEVLMNFRLYKDWINVSGGSKSKVAGAIDSKLYDLGWEEKHFKTCITVDGKSTESPTHKVDCYKNSIALEVEWNNKDPFFDRDLNNFRLLFDLRVISVGIIITRSDNLQKLFDNLGRGKSYGASTTHIKKLKPRIDGGGGGGCPILVIGIKDKLYTDKTEEKSRNEEKRNA